MISLHTYLCPEFNISQTQALKSLRRQLPRQDQCHQESDIIQPRKLRVKIL